jgi:hypothetical protein
MVDENGQEFLVLCSLFLVPTKIYPPQAEDGGQEKNEKSAKKTADRRKTEGKMECLKEEKM